MPRRVDAPGLPAVAARERPAADNPALPVPRGAPAPPAERLMPPVMPGAAATPVERAPSPRPPIAAAPSQDMIAKLRLQLLVYSDVPAERLVFINNRKYLEGQSIDGGVTVERITPDGAVLSYQGERFTLRAESMGSR